MTAAQTRRSTGGLRLFGIEIRVRFSWLIIAVLAAWSLAAGSFPEIYQGLPASAYWTMAILVVVGLAVSIILHELAHSLVGRALGVPIDRITLFLFGGAAELREEPTTARAELLMALAGPALSVVLGVLLALVAGSLERGGGSGEIVGALGYLATLNLVLAAFNMAPAFPMDGGRVVRALIWMATGNLDRATRIAGRMGEGFAILLILAGLGMALLGAVAGGLWWMLIGVFLKTAARSSVLEARARRLLRGHVAREVMEADLKILPGDMTLEEFVDRGLHAGQHGIYPVILDGAAVGVVEAADILAVPKGRWADTTLADICAPMSQAGAIDPDADARGLLDRMTRDRRNRLLVVDHGRPVGLVTLHALLERLELAAPFERDRGGKP